MSEKRLEKIYNGLLVFAICNLLILFVIYQNPDFKINLISLMNYKEILLKGYGLTIGISLISLIISLLMGMGLFLMSISKKLIFNYCYEVYTQIALGVPLLVHVVVIYFFFISATGIDNEIIAGVLILSGYMSAYFAKTFQGAYEAIEEQQFKIMHILGLPRHVQLRKIIMPQVITNTLPALTSNFSLLVKSTALLSLISVPEFTNYINAYNSKSLEFVTGYMMLAIGYLIITVPLSYLAKWMNKKVVG
ncbi:MAG: ABC transporter permease subunit [Cellulosilyticaceae bacterium]